MTSRREFMRSTIAASAWPLVPCAVLAQGEAYPTKPVHAICGGPPGSGADIFVRFYCDKLKQLCGGTIVVENKVGAFGTLASEYVARSKPDGYTIFVAPASSFLAAAPFMFKQLNFDPVNDFEHVTTLSAIPFILLVAADSKYKTVSDLVADLKEKGDKASYGSTSLPGVVSSELFKVSFGLQTVEVKYKDTAPMLNELVAGNLVFGHLDPASAMGYVKQGKIRALATSSKQRFVSLPDIPSASEAGIQNSDVVGWWSVHVPKGTPTPIVTKLETWFNQIAVDDDVKAFLANLGADPLPGNAVMLKELLVKEIASWKEYVKLAKIEPMG